MARNPHLGAIRARQLGLLMSARSLATTGANVPHFQIWMKKNPHRTQELKKCPCIVSYGLPGVRAR